MRTFGTFLVAVVFAVAAGCGGGSSNNGTSSSGRSASSGGMCPGSSSSGEVCTGEEAYANCELSACGTEYKACFGANYASGNYAGGACADWMNCMMACPCDATATTCETNCSMTLATAAGQTCMTCLLSLQACTDTGAGASCTQPVCTSTNTTTSTATSTSTTTSTGTNCAALAACCARMTDATMQTACQSAASSAGGVDSTCALILPQLQSYCP
jgi:hypothetical protein